MTWSPNGSFTAMYNGLPSVPVARASCDSVMGCDSVMSCFGGAVEEVDIDDEFDALVMFDVCDARDGCLLENKLCNRAMESIAEMVITSTG